MAAITAEVMQARFKELVHERDAVHGQTESLRAQKEAIQAQIQLLEAQLVPIVEQIQQIEKPLYEMQIELGMIARALNGKTGDPYAKDS